MASVFIQLSNELSPVLLLFLCVLFACLFVWSHKFDIPQGIVFVHLNLGQHTYKVRNQFSIILGDLHCLVFLYLVNGNGLYIYPVVHGLGYDVRIVRDYIQACRRRTCHFSRNYLVYGGRCCGEHLSEELRFPFINISLDLTCDQVCTLLRVVHKMKAEFPCVFSIRALKPLVNLLVLQFELSFPLSSDFASLLVFRTGQDNILWVD